MPSPQHFLNYLHAFLSKPAVYSSAPLSLLLIGLAALIEPKLLCPCRYGRNASQIFFIFVGPAFFTFMLMLALLRIRSTGKNKNDAAPSDTERNENDAAPSDTGRNENDAAPSDTERNENDAARSSAGKTDADDVRSKKLGEILLYCLIPPLIWMIILLIDGDYVACGMTTWEGNYVFDEEINIKWCQPIEHVGNKSDLRFKNQKIIWESQLSGYVLILIFRVLITGTAVYHDWHKKTEGAQDGTQTGTKRSMCHWLCCKASPPEEHDGAQDKTQDEVEDLQDRVEIDAQDEAQEDAQDEAQDDAQDDAENQPQVENKPLLSPTAEEADSSV